MNTLTVIANAGRSGSSFLSYLLERNYRDECYVAHEDIPVQVSKPRRYNRAYEPARQEAILRDEEFASYLDKWEEILQDRPIVETGWTCSHLLPILLRRFGERLRVVVMHRHPIKCAFSRANMGNYHPQSFYDRHHEVNPNDPYSIAPEKKDLWPDMNHFEKCMYWWSVIYKEALEFQERHPEVPGMVVRSSDIFSFRRVDSMLQFIGLDPGKLTIREVPKNVLARFMRETFPVGEAWKQYDRHEDILGFAARMGYSTTPEEVAVWAQKYQLPEGFLPQVRHTVNYWRLKNTLARPVKKVLGMSTGTYREMPDPQK